MPFAKFIPKHLKVPIKEGFTNLSKNFFRKESQPKSSIHERLSGMQQAEFAKMHSLYKNLTNIGHLGPKKIVKGIADNWDKTVSEWNFLAPGMGLPAFPQTSELTREAWALAQTLLLPLMGQYFALPGNWRGPEGQGEVFQPGAL